LDQAWRRAHGVLQYPIISPVHPAMLKSEVPVQVCPLGQSPPSSRQGCSQTAGLLASFCVRIAQSRQSGSVLEQAAMSN
jgi:hypothetical protein